MEWHKQGLFLSETINERTLLISHRYLDFRKKNPACFGKAKITVGNQPPNIRNTGGTRAEWLCNANGGGWLEF